MTIDAEVAIRNAAELLKDDFLLLKVDTSGDFVAKEVMYYHSYRKSYLNRAERVQKSVEQDAYNPRNIHEQCFEVVKNDIQKSILDERRPELATSVFERYRQEFLRRKGKK